MGSGDTEMLGQVECWMVNLGTESVCCSNELGKACLRLNETFAQKNGFHREMLLDFYSNYRNISNVVCDTCFMPFLNDREVPSESWYRSFLADLRLSPAGLHCHLSPATAWVRFQTAAPAGANGNGASVTNGGSIPGNVSQLPLVGGVDNRKNSNVLPIAVSAPSVSRYRRLSGIAGRWEYVF